jgi:hypothetical protein
MLRQPTRSQSGMGVCRKRLLGSADGSLDSDLPCVTALMTGVAGCALADAADCRVGHCRLGAGLTWSRKERVVAGHGLRASRARERMKIEDSSQPSRVARLSHQSISSPSVDRPVGPEGIMAIQPATYAEQRRVQRAGVGSRVQTRTVEHQARTGPRPEHFNAGRAHAGRAQTIAAHVRHHDNALGPQGRMRRAVQLRAVEFQRGADRGTVQVDAPPPRAVRGSTCHR